MKKAILLLGLLLCSCNHLFYYPNKIQYADPEQYKLNYKKIEIDVGKGTHLAAWYFSAAAKAPCKKRLLVHFHGNAQNLTSHFLQLAWVVQQGMDYLIFDYPGYGESGGKANRDEIHEASVNLLRQVFAGQRVEFKDREIILYGQSLGGAILMGALAEVKPTRQLEAVILESTFLSYQKIAQRKLASAWFTWPFQWLGYVLVTDSHSAKDQLSDLELPSSLVIHGENDNVVEIIEGQEIFAALRQPKEFWRVPLAGHLQVLDPRLGIQGRLIKKLCY